MGGQGQYAGVPKDAPSPLIRVLDLTELRPGYPVDPVVASETLIEEGVVRIVQIKQAAVLSHETVEKRLGLAAHVGGELEVV